MTQAIEVRTSKLKALDSEYTLIFVNGAIYIDVQKFWKENCDIREDLFPPPEYYISLLNVEGLPLEEIHVCKISDLLSRLQGIPGKHYAWRDYISAKKLERATNLCSIFEEVSPFGHYGLLHMNCEPSLGWED